MTKNFILQVPPYPVEVMVSINETNDQLIRKVKRWLLNERTKLSFVESIEQDDVKEIGGVVYDCAGCGTFVLRISDPIKSAESHGCLAHEIFHVVEKVADHIGMKHCSGSSEAFAYMISYLTENIYKRLK